jgi:hypothetical protein
MLCKIPFYIEVSLYLLLAMNIEKELNNLAMKLYIDSSWHGIEGHFPVFYFSDIHRKKNARFFLHGSVGLHSEQFSIR